MGDRAHRRRPARGAAALLAAAALCLGLGAEPASARRAARRAPRVAPAAPAEPAVPVLRADRVWQALPRDGTPRERMREAAARLGSRVVVLCRVEVDAARLERLAATPVTEPLERAVREDLGLPVDVDDFLLFLDDVAAQRTPDRLHLPSGRARSAGVLLHPQDVFDDNPRVWGATAEVRLDEPLEPEGLEPVDDGSPLGPGWSARFPNPSTEEEMLLALYERSPSLANRLQWLTDQLRAQGAEVTLASTLRRRERGYLMWGAFRISKARKARQLWARVGEVERVAAENGIDVDITWRDPGGWRATRAAAQQMAEAYDVVFATRSGALSSNHYDGKAFDLSVTALPRRLELLAPDGAWAAFDLSGAEQARDLSLTPEVVVWIEEHFGLAKLRSDYPHWDDVAEQEAVQIAQGASNPP